MWSKDGFPIEEDDQCFETTITKDDDNTFHSTLTIMATTPEDAGTYKVTARNEEGEETVTVSVLVESKFRRMNFSKDCRFNSKQMKRC